MIRLSLTARELSLIPTRLSDADYIQECACLAMVKNHGGGSGAYQLRKLYPTKLYGDLIYSNIAVRGVLISNAERLPYETLSIKDTERRKGLCWTLVGVSKAHEHPKGGKFVSAAILGIWYDETGEKRSIKLKQGEMVPPLPIYWFGSNDAGQDIDWLPNMKEQRNRNVRAAAEDRDKESSRPKR